MHILRVYVLCVYVLCVYYFSGDYTNNIKCKSAFDTILESCGKINNLDRVWSQTVWIIIALLYKLLP